jgi:DNA polymerase (family X)
VEINGSPRRLELDWRWHREAIRRGVLLSIGPDAHSTRELDYFRHGVRIARKGWVSAENVLNTRTASGVAAWVRSRR